jgi:hypothetical protein
VRAVAAIVLIAACSGHDDAPAPPPSVPRHKDPMGAVRACERAIHASVTAPRDQARIMFEGCAGVIVDDRCRAAFLARAAATDSPIEELRAACAAAYCPSLPEPRPIACSRPVDDLGELWHAIYLHDLGPKPTAELEAATGGVRTPLAPGTWRTPILLITPDTVELRWRRPGGGPDEAAEMMPLASWRCPTLLDALVEETKRTWGRTPVRPPESEELLASVDPKAPDATVMAILNCVNDPSAPRPPYKDVVIRPEPSQ